jgi:hypothetical protein
MLARHVNYSNARTTRQTHNFSTPVSFDSCLGMVPVTPSPPIDLWHMNQSINISTGAAIAADSGKSNVIGAACRFVGRAMKIGARQIVSNDS